MSRDLAIRRLTVREYEWKMPGLGVDYNGFNQRLRAGRHGAQHRPRPHDRDRRRDHRRVRRRRPRSSYAQVGMVAQLPARQEPAAARADLATTSSAPCASTTGWASGPLDIALWDIAGKLYDAPIYRAAGRLPDDPAGLRQHLPRRRERRPLQPRGRSPSSPCSAGRWATRRSRSTAGATGPIEREVATVLATRKAVGDEMDLMIDPACEYDTWGEALKVGPACDEARFFWYEDPYKDGGISAFAHRKLRQIIKTPLLIGRAHPRPGAARGQHRRRRAPTTCAPTPTTTAASPA